MSKHDDALKDIRVKIINIYLSDDILPIEVYECLVDEVDLGLFNNNKEMFRKFVEDVTFDAVYTSILTQRKC